MVKIGELFQLMDMETGNDSFYSKNRKTGYSLVYDRSSILWMVVAN
jgi:hypothetical protein